MSKNSLHKRFVLMMLYEQIMYVAKTCIYEMVTFTRETVYIYDRWSADRQFHKFAK